MGDLVQFVRKTPEEKRGQSNGHKFRAQDPKDIAINFYLACWDEAADTAKANPLNRHNTARTCVETQKMAIAFIDAGIRTFRKRGNDIADQTADALEKLRTRTARKEQPLETHYNSIRGYKI